VKHARQRWAAYVDCEADVDLLDGDALLHTDFNPLNILLGPDRTWIIDWAWPTRGAAFIDAACFLIRVMAAGHSAAQAEALAAQCPGWQRAPSAAIDVFALASARLYTEIAGNDPQPFKQRLAAVAHEWACHRLGTNMRYRQVTRY
jgi:thiamine kinase-like enzyme